MKKLNLLFFCPLLLLACDDNGISHSDANPYLPLAVNNEWKFKPTGNTYGEIYRFMRVIDKVNRNNHEYYAVVSGTAVVEETITDTTYYRIDRNGFVFSLSTWNKGSEVNSYRLDASDGDSWSYDFRDYKASVSVSVAPLTIGAKVLDDCKSFFYDVDVMVDEEGTTTFAKGIGFVKFDNGWSGSVLKSAIIDGHKINF